ncbi:hypothetical protein F511_44686 [Dorcoceras hygrometricum]|uniref:Uncharacterized protein n=1 Tax=Dorcoceras hygrometricum TaxID=472368 RepID=A0A2Z7AUI1_9LAMI|nr:hypothetical protein F511_44686 [Dorcoceras hygrometricum]
MRNFKGVVMRRRFENFARSADGLFCFRELLSADICCGVVLPSFLTFLVALDSLRLALSIDASLEVRSDELRNPEGPVRS